MPSFSLSSFKNSLVIKGVLAAVLIVTTVFALLTPNALRLLDTLAEEQVHLHNTQIGTLLNSAISTSLFSRNSQLTNETLIELLKHPQQNLSYILVYTNEGDLFAQAGTVNPELLPTEDNSMAQALNDGIYDDHTILKLDNEILGSVRYGFSLNSQVTINRKLRQRVTVVVLSALLATAALFSLFGFGLTRQLRKLILATNAIAAGDYSKKVEVSSKDEIGQLSLDFNTMVDAVRDKIVTIHKRERYLNSINDNIPGMVFRCQNDRNWTVNYVSAGVLQLTGYDANYFLDDENCGFAFLVHEKDQERLWNEVQVAVTNKQSFSTSTRITTKQGELKWVLARGRLVKGTTDTLEGVVIDITSQKQAEIALQKSEERLSNIVNNSLQGILIQSNRVPLYANTAFAEMLGYDSVADCLAVDSINSYVSPKDLPRLNRYLHDREQNQPAPERYEFEALKKDGSTVMMETIVTTINREEDGKLTLQHILIDISEQRKAEQQSALYLEQLAQLNRVNILGEMTAGIAHELNQPLTSIVTRSGAARRRIATGKPELEKIDRALEVISNQALRAGNVMQKMRDLVEMHVNERILIHPNELIEEALNIVSIDNSMINTHIETELSSDLPLVLVDKIQIQQVILNLLRNAQDAMLKLPPDERIIIVISTKLDKNFIKITITDRGEGIDAETESKLLNSFFTTKETGMGMGLSICRTIVTAHSGQLWFSRNEDKGVSFHITLPTVHSDKDD